MDLDSLKRKGSWYHALRGIYIFVKNTRNFKFIHLPVYVVILIFGFYFRVSAFEWIALVFCIGFMLVAEAFNSAIEVHMGLTSPEYHPHARDTKDIAAGAVVLSGFVALVVLLIVFLPKILTMLQ
ncbi:diacylglycerol kinase family protein [Candidatus Nomurabacteria bacterium]|nr:diacylglycerol kinase family protein [Candidatus Nomurabacteria bacterium]